MLESQGEFLRPTHNNQNHSTSGRVWSFLTFWGNFTLSYPFTMKPGAARIYPKLLHNFPNINEAPITGKRSCHHVNNFFQEKNSGQLFPDRAVIVDLPLIPCSWEDTIPRIVSCTEGGKFTTSVPILAGVTVICPLQGSFDSKVQLLPSHLPDGCIDECFKPCGNEEVIINR